MTATAPTAPPRVLTEWDFGVAWQALNAVVAYQDVLYEASTNARIRDSIEALALARVKAKDAEKALRHSLQIPFPTEGEE